MANNGTEMKEQLSRLERTLESLTSKIDALSELPAKVDALSELPARVDALSKLPARVDELSNKVDALSKLPTRVDELSNKVDALSELPARVDALSNDVKHLSTQVQAIDNRLTRVQVVGEETRDFARNIWDSLESMRGNVDTRFAEAKADTKRQFDDVHKAIKHLGGRLTTIERRP